MNKNCTLYKTTEFIGKKWTLLILLELYKGKDKWKRYSQLKKSLQKITPKMLSLRLKELEKEKILIKRISTNKFPIKCEYALTKTGEEFIKIIKDIKKWALKYKVKNTFCEKSDCKYCEL